MTEPYMSPRTAEKLSADIPVGQRHETAMAIATDMIGNGWSEHRVFAELRAKFPPEKTDKELLDIIRFVVEKNPQPAGFGAPHVNGSRKPLAAPPARLNGEKARSPLETANWWLGGFTLTEDAFVSTSPVTIPEGQQACASLLLDRLYTDQDRINVVCNFTIGEDRKAKPKGGGKTLNRSDWLGWFAEKGVPHSDAGAWVRPNPCAEIGTGDAGAIKDEDIRSFRFVLIESDVLPLDTQLALYAKWKLPIAAVIHSGGDSAHAWVRVAAGDKTEYSALAKRLIDGLKPFGFDSANKNPSRLSRLPGAERVIGSKGDGIQRLLRINPDVQPFTETALTEFLAILAAPLIEEMPFKPVLRAAMNRYQDLYTNRGKLGVPTGIIGFDELTGGLKGGQMIVIAAATGGGKTTVATNIINTALRAKHGVGLFTLEMDRDEIADLLVAMNCSVNRNAFNNGRFAEHDFTRMQANTEDMMQFPLWIADEPTMTVEQIRSQVLRLHAEKRISLIVVDYLQFVSCDAFRDNREQQVANISRAFRSLAKETKLPLIALSQLNDDGKLRESRVIAHDAHIVMDRKGDSAVLGGSAFLTAPALVAHHLEAFLLPPRILQFFPIVSLSTHKE